MTTIKDIETAVSRLPARDLAEFRQWFDRFDAKLWDEKLERDVKSGKLDKLADEAVEDFKQNRCKAL
jgi:hypothetical protein